MPGHASTVFACHAKESKVNVLTAIKDVIGVLLLVFLLPVWMTIGLGVVIVVVVRQLYWWARGNTTVASRLATRGLPPAAARA